jgi:hypothetical protein
VRSKFDLQNEPNFWFGPRAQAFRSNITRSPRRKQRRRAQPDTPERLGLGLPLALDALLPVGVRLDEAGINRKAFAADQALFNAALQDCLKDAPQEIALAETAVPVLREGGMIGDIAVEPEPAEPPVRQIEVDSFAEASLGTDADSTTDECGS